MGPYWDFHSYLYNYPITSAHFLGTSCHPRYVKRCLYAGVSHFYPCSDLSPEHPIDHLTVRSTAALGHLVKYLKCCLS